MHNTLPPNHGLPIELQTPPLIRIDATTGAPSLTSAQYEGLANGVARGASILMVAPTSSGKTDVGVIGIASWLRADTRHIRQAVYLVSHRALARQKHKDLLAADMLGAMGVDPSDLVMSNGDLTIDGNGAVPENPLNARLLIATYEKFLALLASNGHRADMSNFCVVADECQLIGDDNRGRDVEILLTLIRSANCGQFIGLSAVLSPIDINHLSSWLGIQPVVVHDREVPLAYELRTTTGRYTWRTDGPDHPTASPEILQRGTLDILAELAAAPDTNQPVAVFCMSKPRVKELALSWAAMRGVAPVEEGATLDLFGEATTLGGELAAFLPHSFAMHSTDLIDTERALVEDRLERNEIHVVFATSTLAQGLNFPFKTVLFDNWTRWNFERGRPIPISRSELRNMAGRAGRLGMGDAEGKVILSSQRNIPDNVPAQYLGNELEDLVAPHITPEWLDLISLQLLAAQIASTTDGLLTFMQESLSGFISRNENRDSVGYWRQHLMTALTSLREWNFIVGDNDLTVTPLGKAVARSGLQPKTAQYFLSYLSDHLDTIIEFLPPALPHDQLEAAADRDGWDQYDGDLVFLLSNLISNSPEYDDPDTKRRFLPYPLDVRRESPRGRRWEHLLTKQPWDVAVTAINAADIVTDWIQGAMIADIEARFDHDRYPLTGGQINGMLRDQAAFMSGLGDIVEAVSATANTHLPIVAALVPSDDMRRDVRRLLRRIRQLARQIIIGVPEDVLWMLEISNAQGDPLLRRLEILSLRNNGILSLEEIIGGTKTEQYNAAMTAVGATQDRRAEIRTAARVSRANRTASIRQRLMRDLAVVQCQGLVDTFFSARETAFEVAVEACLNCLEFTVVDKDDQTKPRFPDFVTNTPETPTLVIECKSKQNGHEVSLGEATDVGGKAATHGLNRNPMVTVCQPYVATDVPPKLSRAEDLSVVNAEDLAQAFAALRLGRLTKERFVDWLTTPGQPRYDDLFRP